MFQDLVMKNRSYRRFDEKTEIPETILRELVDDARHAASGANVQPLKYVLSFNAENNALIFPHLAWAGYLKDWPGPQAGERPSAYIVVLGDTEISKSFGIDHGIAAQTILLGAVEKGLGGCMIISIRRDDLRTALQIPERFEILMVIALGKPIEEVVLDSVGPDGSIKYWRDENQRHHVPKRELDDLIVKF